MNSVKIGTYQMDTAFGLYLPEYTIPAPAPQTKFVKIIGRDGSVDLSDAIGLHYDSRSWSLDFKCFDPTVNWHTLTSSVMNAIHGKRLNFEFDDDPDYFWTGRISVSSYVSTRGTGTLKVNITSDPFKYAKLSTIVTKTASTGTEYTGSMVTFNNGLIYDLSADIEPIQDLHGYANPWPGGGGANMLDPDKSSRSTATVYGMDITYLGDDTFTIKGQSTSMSASAGFNVLTYSDTSLSGLGYVVQAFIVNDKSNNYKSCYGFRTSTEKSIAVVLNCSVSQDVDITIKFSVATASQASWTPYANICPISGLTGLSVYVSPTQDPDDATVYNVDWTTKAGTVYGGTVDVVTGEMVVDKYLYVYDGTEYFSKSGTALNGFYNQLTGTNLPHGWPSMANYNSISAITDEASSMMIPTRNANTYKQNYGYVYFDSGHNFDVPPEEFGTTVESFKAKLASLYADGTPMTVFCKLATPITYQLTPQEIEALVGTNNIWTSSGNVSVTVVIPETVTNNGLPIVPTVTASADMVLRWGNYSASVQQGTSTIPQLVLETGDNKICIIGTGNISFEWSEASL